MKNIKPFVGILITVISIISLIILFNYMTTINIMDKQKLVHFIEKHDRVTPVSIVKTSKNGELYSVLYQYNNKTRLFILEKSKFIRNRYQYFGGGYNNRFFNTYNFSNSKYALIIVYGDNTKTHAAKYSMKNDDITYSEDLKDMDYVLRIFRIPYSNNISSNLKLYTSDNSELKY